MKNDTILMEIFKFLIFIATSPFMRLSRFKNIHHGEEVYILADSSEIKFYDLSYFDNHPMICFNRSFMINKIKDRRNKTYRILAEPFWFYKFGKNQAQHDEMKSIRHYLKSSRQPYFLHISNILTTFTSNASYLFYRIPNDPYTKEIKNLNIKPFAWTGAAAISLAIYMGFKKINLIGVSHHSKSVSGYWYKDGIGDNIIWNENMWNEFSQHAGIDLETLKNHIEILAIVPHQDSESSFKTITYKEYTNKELFYNETLDMTDKKYAELVSKI